MRRSLLISAALLIAPLAAHAVPWVVDTAQSKLQFSGKQAGDAFNGGFVKFTPVIEFDPAHPEKGHIDVTVDITSGFIENDKDKNAALPTDEWFGAKQFPKAEFHSTAIHSADRLKSGGPAFDVDGNLTIRGISKPATLTFELIPDKNGSSRAVGNVTLKRNDFGIGQGKEWSSDQWIAYPVQVTFTIIATSAK